MPDPYGQILGLTTEERDRLARSCEERFLPTGQDHDRLIGEYSPDLAALGFRTLLESGCGTGRVLDTIGRAVPSATLFGIDPGEQFLAMARARGVAVAQAVGQALPLGTKSVDVVLFHATLAHVADVEGCLAEARRVARSRIAVFDVDLSACRSPTRWSEAMDRFFEEYVQNPDVWAQVAEDLGKPDSSRTFVVEQPTADSYLARHVIQHGCRLMGSLLPNQVIGEWTGGRLAYRFEIHRS